MNLSWQRLLLGWVSGSAARMCLHTAGDCCLLLWQKTVTYKKDINVAWVTVVSHKMEGIGKEFSQ